MTVRARAELSKLLGADTKIVAIWARSTCRGELQVQVDGFEGTQSIFIPSDVPTGSKGLNLLGYASPAQWKKSRSLLAAVRLGHLVVTVEKV
jgi:hypothetical protein